MRGIFTLTYIVVPLLVPFGAGCAKKEPAPAKNQGGGGSLDQAMHENYGRASEARDALMAGDLAGAREPAKVIAATRVSGELALEVRPMFNEVREAAGRVDTSTTVDQAVGELAEMARWCGNCHQTSKKGPTVDIARMPKTQPPGDALPDHAWAARWMWLGLIGGNDAVYADAATALADAKVETSDRAADADKSISRLHAAAAKAAVAQTSEIRADQYADVLRTCADCHQADNVRKR